MAIAKKVKEGGSYYEGYKCVVSSAAGTYVCYIDKTTAYALNSLSVTPDMYGAGDSYGFIHYDNALGGGDIVAVMASNIYNIGKHMSIMYDLPALEKFDANDSLKFSYVNVASVAGNVYLVAEMVGIKVTA